MARIKLLSPIGVVSAAGFAAPAFPTSLAGRTLGIIDNNKPNFDRLVAEMAQLMTERFGIGRVIHQKKANASTPAPPETLAALAKECDVVLTGSAD